jgi:hypothetical protein
MVDVALAEPARFCSTWHDPAVASGGVSGRPRVSRELRELIRQMSKENPLWGAPRIHGELLKLGFEVAESTVSKYMIRRRGPPSQNWRTFLRNHADAIAAIDLCVVPTVTLECLFAFLVVGHGRRQLLWFAVTRHPTAEWLAQQIVEAIPWDAAPVYLVRNNDGAYGPAFTRRIRTMGIRDRPISPSSPWQNPYVERLIGTLRHDCLDHVLIFGEQNLRRLLTSYSVYYNEAHTWGWSRTRHYDEPSNALDPSLSHQSCPDCIIATRGYDFREGPHIANSVATMRRRLIVALVKTLSRCPCCAAPTPSRASRKFMTQLRLGRAAHSGRAAQPGLGVGLSGQGSMRTPGLSRPCGSSAFFAARSASANNGGRCRSYHGR